MEEYSDSGEVESMNLRPRPQEEPDLNLTSLIDVVLLLLIFFMVSTTFVDESRLKIQLPQAGNEPAPEQRRDPIEVAVTASGEFRVDGKTLLNTSPVDSVCCRRESCGRARDSADHDSRRCASHSPIRRHCHGCRRATRLSRDQYRDCQRTSALARRTDIGRHGTYRARIEMARTDVTECVGHLSTLADVSDAHIAASLHSVFSARCCFRRAWCCFSAFAKEFGDGTFENRDPRTIVWLPVALVGFFLIRGIGDFTQTYCMGYVGRHIVKRLRGEIFERVLHLPVGFYDRNSSGALLSRLTYQYRTGRSRGNGLGHGRVRESLTIIGSICCCCSSSTRV